MQQYEQELGEFLFFSFCEEEGIANRSLPTSKNGHDVHSQGAAKHNKVSGTKGLPSKGKVRQLADVQILRNRHSCSNAALVATSFKLVFPFSTN